MSEGSIKDFKILSKLGEGSFSQVFKVKRLSDGLEYAMKKVKMGMLKEKEKQNALNEVRILASIKDDNIVAFKEVFIEEGVNLCVIMEYAQGGDLQKKINDAIKQKRLIPESEIWKFLTQMTKGLKALHDNQILHRDLKCANVFLTKEGNYKLGDLNVSKIAKKGLVYTQTGTPYYASPEVWRDEAYDGKSDIWSLGCVIYEMAALKPPFRANDMEGLYRKVQKGIFDRIPTKYSTDLQNVIAALLKVNPNQRPNCNAILNNPIVQRHGNDTTASVKKQGKAQSQQPLLNTIQLPKNLGLLKGKLPKAQYDIEKDQDESGDNYDEELLKYIYQNRESSNNNNEDGNIFKEKRKQLKSAGLQRPKVRGVNPTEENDFVQQNEKIQKQHMMRPQSGRVQIRPSSQVVQQRQRQNQNNIQQQQNQLSQQQKQQNLRPNQEPQKNYDYNNYSSVNKVIKNGQKRQEDDESSQNLQPNYSSQVSQNYSQLHSNNLQLHQKVKVNEKKLNDNLIQKRQQQIQEEHQRKLNEQKQMEMLYKKKMMEQQKQQILKQQQEIQQKNLQKIKQVESINSRPQSSLEQSGLQKRYNNVLGYQQMQKQQALKQSRDYDFQNQRAQAQEMYYQSPNLGIKNNKMRPLSSQVYGSGIRESYESLALEKQKYDQQLRQIKAQQQAQRQNFENNQLGGVKKNINAANQYFSENNNSKNIANSRNQGNQLKNLNQYMSKNSNHLQNKVNLLEKNLIQRNIREDNGYYQQNLNNGQVRQSPNYQQNIQKRGNNIGQQYNSENYYSRIQSAQPSKRVQQQQYLQQQLQLQRQREQKQQLAQKKLVEQGQSEYQQQKQILQQPNQNSRYLKISRIQQQQQLGNLQNYQSNNQIPKTTKSYNYVPPQSANYARRNAPSGGYSNNKPSWWG